jgi:hypothetical protein
MNKKGFIYLSVLLTFLIGIGFYFLFSLPKDGQQTPVSKNNETTNRPANFPEAAPIAPDDEECSVSPQSLNPIIDISAPEVATVIKNELLNDEKRYVQHVILKDGTHIEYSEGGCVHFSYQLSISPYAPTEEIRGIWIVDALNNLRRPIFSEDGKDNLNIFIRSLESVQNDSAPAEENGLKLPCGDAHCELRVIDMKLILSYDMAV